MTFNEYQEFVASIKRYPTEYKMLYPTLGLCGEAGEVAEKVKKIIAEHLGIDDMERITEDAKFIDDLGADSLDTVELVMAFEEAFDVEIPDDKAETILTVGDAISHLESK